jgi:DNA-binding NarL/FixJ family response regulator
MGAMTWAARPRLHGAVTPAPPADGGGGGGGAALPVRVVVAASHHALRAGLAALLATEADISMVTVAEDARAAARSVLQHHPDVLVVALLGALRDGGATIRRLRSLAPETAVVLTGTVGGAAYAAAAYAAGAAAVVPLDDPAADLVAVVRAAAGRGSHDAPP